MPPTDQGTPDTLGVTEWRRQLEILLGDVALSFDNPHDVPAHVERNCNGPGDENFRRARLAIKL